MFLVFAKIQNIRKVENLFQKLWCIYSKRWKDLLKSV